MSVTDSDVYEWNVTEWGQALLDELLAVERELWLVVVGALLADVWLTQMGLQQGLHEGNPVMRTLLEKHGIDALVASKIVVLGFGGVARVAVPRRQRGVIPLGLALPWLVAVAVNGTLLFS